MLVRFWGTRGSLPKPGPETVRYGGNTSCVEVRTKSGELIILDCGTGAHALGQSLMQAGPKPIKGHLLIGHTHWDHIQGFPFFTPLFVPKNEWHVYAPQGLGQHLRETLAGQMQYQSFPVELGDLGATIHYHDIVEGEFEVAGVKVRSQYLNHPALTLGYRLEEDGVVLVYSTDHEPHSPQAAMPGPNPTTEPAHREDGHHAEFLRGADLVIHDAQYLASEYPTKVGWGHSTVEYVVDTALSAKVRKLALFHHEPLRSDAAVDQVVAACRARVARQPSDLELFAAAEGQVIELEAAAPSERAVAAPVDLTTPREVAASRIVLVTAGTPALEELLRTAMKAEGFEVHIVGPHDSVITLARDTHPALIFLDSGSTQPHALEVTQALRAFDFPEIRNLPVVVMTPAGYPAVAQAAFAAGATDCLPKPFSAAYVRSRAKAWLLRSRNRWLPPELPGNEPNRLAAVLDLHLLDTPPEERFDRITRLALRMFDVPMATVALIDRDRWWVKSVGGGAVYEAPRSESMCSHTIAGDRTLVVPDLEVDDRFADLPQHGEGFRVRFYAGQPLHTRNGQAVGTLCLLDRRPRKLGDADLAALADLGALVERELG